MDRTEDRAALGERFLLALIEATHPLQHAAPDREVALEALIEAAGVLRDRLQEELAELRREEAD